MRRIHAAKPVLTPQRLRLGVLNNRHSGGNRKNPNTFRKFQTAHPDIAYCEVRTPKDVAVALEEFVRQDINVIAINGGDGTVQAVLSALLQHNLFEYPPLLAPLWAGTTNMIAADVGSRRTPAKALVRLLDWVRAGGDEVEIVTRPILRLQTIPEADPLFGMFFGTGLIYSAIQYSRQYLHPRGLDGPLGSALVLLRFLLAMIRRERDLFTPVTIKVTLDGQPSEKHECAILLVSTLEALLLGLHPYWGNEIAPLHYTLIHPHPRYLVHSLPSLLRGQQSKHMRPEQGYISHNVSEIRLELNSGFTLDGEMFAPKERQEPLILSDGGQASFIRL